MAWLIETEQMWDEDCRDKDSSTWPSCSGPNSGQT